VDKFIRIRLESDADGCGQLFVAYSINGYAGRSSAWFNVIDLKAKVERFFDYPLSIDDLPCIRGGFWNVDGSDIESEHVYLSASPYGSLGNVVLSVRCAIPQPDSNSEEILCSGYAKINVTYQQLEQFAMDLNSLIAGEIDEAVIFG
jgi:hypothetical protein